MRGGATFKKCRDCPDKAYSAKAIRCADCAILAIVKTQKAAQKRHAQRKKQGTIERRPLYRGRPTKAVLTGEV